MSRVKVVEDVRTASSVRSRHVFVVGTDGELLSWSAGAPAAVPASLIAMVRGCLVPFAVGQGSFGEIVMQLDERFSIYIVRNAAPGPSSYAVIVDEVSAVR